MSLKAETPVYGGYVISREGGVVFIKGAIPDEVVEVSILEKKKDYAVAVATSIIEPSSFRVAPRCKYFGDCGGCQLQHMSYERQVKLKEEVMLDCLDRIGGININLLETLKGNDFGYRHRAQFKVSKEGLIGFYREGTREVVPVDSCPLMVDEINTALIKLKSIDLRGVKELHITSGDKLLASVKGNGYREGISEDLRGAGFDGVCFDDLSYIGAGFAVFDLDGLQYRVSPWSFFQGNWHLNLMAISKLKQGLEPYEGKNIIDLYAGAGNFSLPLAGKAGEIVAIEENPHSVKDAERNITANNIKNIRFINEKVEKASFKADIVILDPPRPGLRDRTVKSLLESIPERIVYISCNPSTLARDLKKLLASYDINSIGVMDFFPNTYHIESMTFLTVKSK